MASTSVAATETSCACGCGRPIRSGCRYVNGHNGVRNRSEAPRYLKDADSGCWVWQGAVDALGYGRMWSRAAGGPVLAHRWHYEQRHGNCPTDTLDHLCRNPQCVNPEHLEPVSRAENVRRGTRAKLDWDKVDYIRSSHLSNRELAAQFDVSPSTIGNVRAGRVWREDTR